MASPAPLTSAFKPEMDAFSARIGQNPLLVQGAGGNLSWKENDVLWIKASGTQLGQACEKNIFLPLDLAQVQAGVARGDEQFSYAQRMESPLRPSIETAMHALMPHRIVAHMHALTVLAYAVQKDGEAQCAERLKNLPWAWIPYAKPGAALAGIIAQTLASKPETAILILENHGLVLGAASLPAMQALLEAIQQRLPTSVQWPADAAPTLPAAWADAGYQLAQEPALHALATDAYALAQAQAHWVLYPDHAVFLGACAPILDATMGPADLARKYPEATCVLVKGLGLLEHRSMNHTQKEMLLCYLHLLQRIPPHAQIQSLSSEQIAELLNWDAEKYRQQLAHS